MVKSTKARGYYNPKGAGKRKRVRSRLARKRVRKGLVRDVKQIISSLTETKQAWYSTGDSLVKCNSGIDSTGDMFQVIPNITQSTADNGRIGDQVRAKSLNIKGFVKMDIGTPLNGTAIPTVLCRMMVVSLKSKPNYTEASSSSAPLASLLKKGGVTTNFNGYLRDIYAPINTDLFTIHHDRKFYLRQDYNNGAAGPMDISRTIKFFNLPVRCKNRLLKYDSAVSSGLLPTNFGPMILFGYTFLDGSAPDSVSTRLGIQYDTIFNYEDA